MGESPSIRKNTAFEEPSSQALKPNVVLVLTRQGEQPLQAGHWTFVALNAPGSTFICVPAGKILFGHVLNWSVISQKSSHIVEPRTTCMMPP